MSLSCSGITPQPSHTDLEYANQNSTQWYDTPSPIEYAKRSETTMLIGGVAPIQDRLIRPALKAIGENYVALPNPTFESFQTGKAFGNRGQCNPTYFTVGNLIKYLQNLRDVEGLSTEEIVQKYLFVTAGGCGPCRFGMYITEYRKALGDAGFAGFRVMNFEHNKGIFQATDTEQSITDFSPRFFVLLIKAFMLGDIINLLGYRVRPYEVLKGETDRAMARCEQIVADALEHKKSLILAMRRCRQEFAKVELDRLRVKPKVMVIGEFWAALTEGDGNYNLHRFLEAEGAECVPQPLMNRLMLSIWEAEYSRDTAEGLAVASSSRVDFSSLKSKLLIQSAKLAIKTHFYLYAQAIGLHDYKLADMDELAKLGAEYYPVDSNGGEGHIEVAHLIESVKHNLSHLVISVKPFGCMPSSAVSDGIQSLVTSHYPSANFLPIETSGEGAANFYSRVQMALFKAKQLAKEEYDAVDMPSDIPTKIHDFLYQPSSKLAGSAARLMNDHNQSQ